MVDLISGALVIGSLAAAIFALFGRLSRRFSYGQQVALAASVVAALLYYVSTLWYDVRMARWLPVSNLVIVGNWLPLIAAALAALVWRQLEVQPARRALCLAGLGSAALLSMVYPLLGAAPECRDRWDKLGTCLQSTERTCSPAAAATLLRQHGIAATEQEMAELCLTREGTSWLGLFRGLKLKTAGTPYDVEVVACTASQLEDFRGQPLLLSVGLPRGGQHDPAYTHEFGWQPGVNHSVVLLRYDAAGNALVADPALEMCREYWSPEMLDTLWRGYAFRLVPRITR
jgi:hypothetical protein